jgi:hypothetical protein
VKITWLYYEVTQRRCVGRVPTATAQLSGVRITWLAPDHYIGRKIDVPYFQYHYR